MGSWHICNDLPDELQMLHTLAHIPIGWVNIVIRIGNKKGVLRIDPFFSAAHSFIISISRPSSRNGQSINAGRKIKKESKKEKRYFQPTRSCLARVLVTSYLLFIVVALSSSYSKLTTVSAGLERSIWANQPKCRVDRRIFLWHQSASLQIERVRCCQGLVWHLPRLEPWPCLE